MKEEEQERLRVITIGFPTPQIYERLPVGELMRRFDGAVVIGISSDRPRMAPNPRHPKTEDGVTDWGSRRPPADKDRQGTPGKEKPPDVSDANLKTGVIRVVNYAEGTGRRPQWVTEELCRTKAGKVW